MRSWSHQGRGQETPTCRAAVNKPCNMHSGQALGNRTEVWLRGYSADPHSYLAVFSGFSESPLQVLLILKAEATKVFLIIFWRKKKKKEFVYYSVCYIYNCNFISLADLSSKFASRRLRLQYWIVTAWEKKKNFFFWDTQEWDEKLRSLLFLAVNSPLPQQCFSIIVKTRVLISLLSRSHA